MSPSRQVFLVAVRDFKERITSRAFQLSTAFTVLLVVVVMLLPSFFDDDAPTWDVGVVGVVPDGLGALIEAAAPEDGTTVDLSTYDGIASAEAALTEGEIDIAVHDGEIVTAGAASPQLVAITSSILGSFRATERAAELGLSPADLAGLLASATPEVRRIDPDDPEEDDNRIVAFVGMILLFISIVTYGQWILVGVIEEKSSRVVEVVLGAVRPHRLLTGKVLGIGALGLAQLVLVGGIALALGAQSDAIELPPAAATVAGSVVVWFLLGFAFYATAYAAAGSLVSRQEEAQNAAFPLTMLLMIAYFIASFSLSGDNTVLRIASLVPPTAPMTMPVRMAAGDARLWEIVLSLTAMVTVTYLLVRLAGRIYAGGLLRSGAKIKVRDAWRSAEPQLPSRTR
jgi:ABC-2 type transport system permease protein